MTNFKYQIKNYRNYSLHILDSCEMIEAESAKYCLLPLKATRNSFSTGTGDTDEIIYWESEPETESKSSSNSKMKKNANVEKHIRWFTGF